MNARLSLGIGALVLALASGAAAAPTKSSGALELRMTLSLAWRFSDSYCQPGTRPGVQCVGFRGARDIPGLGRAAWSYVKTVGEDNGCPVTQFRTALLEVAGKGAIQIALEGGPHCGPYAPAEVGPYTLRITGGSGDYARALGSLEWRSSVYAGSPTCQCGAARDLMSGSLEVPGLEFDLTAPVLSGARSKTLRAAKRAKRVRVRYAVRATDAIDGSVPVSCAPRSGSFFKVGRTTVRCSATDSSANSSRTQFTITVRR